MATATTPTVYLDSNIVFYAASADRSFGESCTRVLRDIQEGKVHAIASALIVAEVANTMRRAGRAKGMERVAAAMTSMPIRFYEVTDALALEGVRLARESDLSPFDGIHAATMLAAKVQTIVSTDTDFDRLGAVRRIDPRMHAIPEA